MPVRYGYKADDDDELKNILEAQFRQNDKIDPARKARKVWKQGHEPSESEDRAANSPYQYLKLDVVGPTLPPNQRHLLKGGPESGLTCQCNEHPTCTEETRIAGRRSSADIMRQPEVEIVGLELISEARWKELEEEFIYVLACPKCYCLTQVRDLLLKRLQKARERLRQ
jgi:hypothetical protein